MRKQPKIARMDACIASMSPEARGPLEEVRRVVRSAVPSSASETVSYRMPALKRNKVFFYYAAFKKHLRVYPPVKGDL